MGEVITRWGLFFRYIEYEMHHSSQKGEALCHFRWIMSGTLENSFSCLIVILSLERLYLQLLPRMHASSVSKLVLLSVVVASWVISLVLTSIQMYVATGGIFYDAKSGRWRQRFFILSGRWFLKKYNVRKHETTLWPKHILTPGSSVWQLLLVLNWRGRLTQEGLSCRIGIDYVWIQPIWTGGLYFFRSRCLLQPRAHCWGCHEIHPALPPASPVPTILNGRHFVHAHLALQTFSRTRSWRCHIPWKSTPNLLRPVG